jgi:RNA-directed DNA polymerase
MQQLSLFDETLFSCLPGEARGDDGKAHQAAAASERTKPMVVDLMDQVVNRENLIRALKRVCANKGSPGIDGMTVDGLTGYLREHWQPIRERLLRGDYCPQPVKEVSIPGPSGISVGTPYI